MAKSVIVIRIDPAAEAIAKLALHAPRNPNIVLRNVQRMVRAPVVQAREIVDMQPVPLMLAVGMDIAETMLGFRLPGMDEIAGIGILFGRGPNGGMVDVPVDVDWVRKRISWTECIYESEDA